MNKKKIFLLAALLFTIALAVCATPTYVGGTSGSTSGCGGSGACVLNLTQTGFTSGNYILFGAATNANTGITPTVNLGGACVTKATSTNNSYTLIIGYCSGMSSGNPVVTFTGTNTFRISAAQDEFNGVAGFDVVATWNDPFTTQTSVTTTSTTPSVNGDLCYTVGVDENAQGGTPTPASPFTARSGPGSGGTDTVFPVVAGSYVQPTAGAITLTWSSFGAAAKPAAGMLCMQPTGSTVAPVNTAQPTISTGSFYVQTATLTAANGTWSNSPTSYTYQWQRCGLTGVNCSNIGSATSQSYVMTSSDGLNKLQVLVTAVNATGSSTTASTQTPLVASYVIQTPQVH